MALHKKNIFDSVLHFKKKTDLQQYLQERMP